MEKISWDSVLKDIGTRLPSDVSSQQITNTNIKKISHQFYISGVDHRIHYEISFKEEGVFLGLHCEQMYLSSEICDLFTNIAKQFNLKLSYNNSHIFIEKNIDIKYLAIECLHFIFSTKDDVKAICSDANVNTNIMNVLHVLNEKIDFIFDAVVSDKINDPNFIFDNIYSHNKWGKGSGPGSDPKILKSYIDFLNGFIAKNKIRSICDIGCGDWQYMQHIDLNDVEYTGYDVAKDIVKENDKKFSKNNISFEYYDGDFSKIKNADLAICKEVLQHLPNEYIHEFIKISKKFKYTLCVNVYDDQMKENADIKMGQCRCLDLRLPPFNMNAELIHKIKRPNDTDIAVFLLK